MYKAEVREIAAAFFDKPEQTLINVVDFALATIQQQFFLVPTILEQWERWELTGADEEDKPGTMWGMKRQGWWYVRENQSRLAALMRYHLNQGDTVGAIDTLLEIPGLGIVKAGFVAQLLGLPVGCLDVHNLRLYQIEESFSSVPAGARGRLALIESYVVLCDRLGGAEKLWDVWCEFVHMTYPSHFMSAEEVSATHTLCILGV